jgi:ribosome-binding factor A
MHSRGESIRKTLIKELSDIIQHKVKDPRIQGIISVTDIELSHDYRYAKVYISIYGTPETKKEIMEAIDESTSFIRGELGKRIKIRFTPELHFLLDESVEKASRINELLDKISKGEV